MMTALSRVARGIPVRTTGARARTLARACRTTVRVVRTRSTALEALLARAYAAAPTDRPARFLDVRV